MAGLTAERRARYQANRKARYQNEPEYRAVLLARMKLRRSAHASELNERRRLRWKSDPEYREKRLAARRGRSQRADQLKTHYGLTLDQFNAMAAAQNHRCAVCGEQPEGTLCVDHCHTSERVRGLLCRKCNTGLGCFKDNPELFAKAVAYLKHHGN